MTADSLFLQQICNPQSSQGSSCCARLSWDSPAALVPQRAVCHGGEEQLAALCEMSAFSQDTHCLSAAPASTLLAHSAVADVSLIKEKEQFEFSFLF